MPGKAPVVDANILIRSVLGVRVRAIIEAYATDVSFFLLDVAYVEAEEHLRVLVIKRGGDPGKGLALLSSMSRLMDVVGASRPADPRASMSPGWVRQLAFQTLMSQRRDPHSLRSGGIPGGSSVSSPDGRALIVVSDTSPVLNLARIGRLDLLSMLYQKVIIPSAVYQELMF
jgi:hypothetical protein